MKEKKVIASVVFGVALVSLIGIIIAEFAESLILLIDAKQMHTYKMSANYSMIVGGMILAAVILGLVYVVVFFANKKDRDKVNLGLAIAVAAFCVIAIIVLRCLIGGTVTFNDNKYEYQLYLEKFAVFTASLPSILTLAVSCALMQAASTYLSVLKKKEKAEQEAVQAVETPLGKIAEAVQAVEAPIKNTAEVMTETTEQAEALGENL